MFWSKCNKLLVNAYGELINCDNCPCGYWAVFGFKWRWLDSDTMQPDPCRWNFSVQVKEVKDNKIKWDYCCVEISSQMGLCGTKKGKFNCWENCWEWDQQGNCINGQEYCDCIQVEVYNISGCYDKFNEFEATFWGGCGVTPDSSGNYPDMWQYYYGSQYQSSAAYDCVKNYWQKIFSDKYLLNFNLEVQRMNQNWWQQAAGIKEKQLENYYCGDDNCYYVSAFDGSCAEGLQVCTEYIWTGEIQGFLALCYLENDSSIRKEIVSPIPPSGSNVGSCCAEVETAAALPELNAFITEKVNNKEAYFLEYGTTYTCTNSDNVCAQAEYESKCCDNFYGSCVNCRFKFNWARLKLSRNDQTPADAAGVKFLCKITHTRENIGYERQQIIVENLEQEISIKFDDVYQDLPLATNINLMRFLETPECTQQCQYAETGTWKNEPHFLWNGTPYPNDVWVDKYQIQIIGLDYIK